MYGEFILITNDTMQQVGTKACDPGKGLNTKGHNEGTKDTERRLKETER